MLYQDSVLSADKRTREGEVKEEEAEVEVEEGSRGREEASILQVRARV